MHHYMEFNILAMTKAIHKHDLIPPDVIPDHSLQLKSRPACSMCRTIYERVIKKNRLYMGESCKNYSYKL